MELSNVNSLTLSRFIACLRMRLPIVESYVKMAGSSKNIKEHMKPLLYLYDMDDSVLERFDMKEFLNRILLYCDDFYKCVSVEEFRKFVIEFGYFLKQCS